VLLKLRVISTKKCIQNYPFSRVFKSSIFDYGHTLITGLLETLYLATPLETLYPLLRFDLLILSFDYNHIRFYKWVLVTMQDIT